MGWSFRLGVLLAIAPLACSGATPSALGSPGATLVDDTGQGEGGASPGPSGGGDASLADAPAPITLRVLFIGNSYTYVNDVPGQVRALVQSAPWPAQITVDSVTEAGATLKVLYDEGNALAKVRAGGWTHVVLQGQSLEAVGPVFDTAPFLDYAKRFGDEAVAVGAKPVYYETWARRAGDPTYAQYSLTPASMQAAIRESYASAAASVQGAVVAPVGDAWELALAEPSPPNLFQDDGSHPSTRGTYLAGCVFVRVLTRHAATGLGGAPADIAPAEAARLQAIADRAGGS
jgi:hypothetical protein